MMLQRSSKSTFRGFTLIEILVVVAIIALLAAILFPVFARARESARKASCASNMKQLATAWLMYTQDYDEKAAPSNYWIDSQEHAWDFTFDWTGVAPGDPPLSVKGGFLYPYTKSGQINACPSFHGNANGRPSTGYAYNSTYIGGEFDWTAMKYRESASLAQIMDPSGTALFAEGGYGNPVNGQNYLRAPSDPYNGAGAVDFRHNGTANVAYADGHVKAATKKFNPRSAEPSIGDLSADDSAYDLN